MRQVQKVNRNYSSKLCGQLFWFNCLRGSVVRMCLCILRKGSAYLYRGLEEYLPKFPRSISTKGWGDVFVIKLPVLLDYLSVVSTHPSAGVFINLTLSLPAIPSPPSHPHNPPTICLAFPCTTEMFPL